MSEESKVALAISAGGNFGRAPDNLRPRGYLGGVRWGCPWRSPKTLAVSGGVSLRCQGSIFWRRVHFLRASPRWLSYRRAGHLVPQSSPASWLANRPCHSVPLAAPARSCLSERPNLIKKRARRGDIMSPEKRSVLMSRIKGRDTGPERLVASALEDVGLFWESHAKDQPRFRLSRGAGDGLRRWKLLARMASARLAPQTVQVLAGKAVGQPCPRPAQSSKAAAFRLDGNSPLGAPGRRRSSSVCCKDSKSPNITVASLGNV